METPHCEDEGKDLKPESPCLEETLSQCTVDCLGVLLLCPPVCFVL